MKTGRRKLPWDAKLMGIFSFFSAAIMIWSGLPRVLGLFNPDEQYLAMFGILRLTSSFSIGTCFLLHAGVVCVSGYGLLKGRAFGWWLLMYMSVSHLPDTIRSIHGGVSQMLTIVLASLWIAWALFRIRLYDPFGTQARKSRQQRAE